MRPLAILLPALLAAPQAAAPPDNPAAPVVAAVAAAARENASLPPEKRATGDALGDLYVRKAAAAAGGDARRFLVGLAHAVDPAGTLERHPFTAAAFRGLESWPEGKARKEALGKPTLRGRNDLFLHFTASAAVAALAGREVAEAVGLAKERADAKGGSGFSFADLLADLAGIRFARWLGEEGGRARLERVAKEFTGEAHLPDFAGQPEGLAEAALAERFGSSSDERFRAKVKSLRDLVDALPVYREAKAPAPR